MHKDFADWYRIAGLEPKNDFLPKRWEAIEKYEPEPSDIISLTRMFCRLGNVDDAFLTKFRAVFQETDNVFPMRDNDQELCVLAGCELVDLILRGSKNLATFAALSLVSASVQNLRPSPCIPEIPELAASYLRKQSVNRAVPSKANDEGANAELYSALTELGTPYDQLTEEFRKVQTELSIVSEESNMLWWLFAEHSRDEQKRWSEFSVPAAALMSGKELADLTRIVPGPFAASAFLDRVIRSAKTKLPAAITLTDAINDSPLTWRQKYYPTNCSSQIDSLIPITYAIKLSLNSPDNNDWLPAFVKGAGISANAKLAPQLLSLQVFHEGLLCRSWKSLNSHE
ncbi:MAG: hypothetical protein JWM68_3581 [Verrucomicrobiales bacterium]|nr:hypothetical protein [Verrucomicrobiales bacterium]